MNILNCIAAVLLIMASTADLSFSKIDAVPDIEGTYDLLIIGGGSAGLACAKEASQYNKSVLVLDYVTRSSKGTQWGIGGTCINAGCIPKKLFHQASLLRNEVMDANEYGWNTSSIQDQIHSWNRLTQNVNDYIQSLRWKLSLELKQKNIELKRAYGSFLDKNKVKAMMVVNNPATDGHEMFKNFNYAAKDIVIAIGCRQNIPNRNLKKHCITSDDIFYMKKPPGKTLVIGGGYIGIEVAGFLNGLGYPVTLSTRGKILSTADQQMAHLVKEYMTESGITFCMNCDIVKIMKQCFSQNTKCTENEKKYYVTLENRSTKEQFEDYFDTIFCATGRRPQVEDLQLNDVGVKYDLKTGKIPVTNEQTNVPHIYAIGDVVQGAPELTPVAMRAGKLLARRLYGGSDQKMDYKLVPTVVFSPLEYSYVGLSEIKSIREFGDNAIEVYHGYYYPLEWEIPRYQMAGEKSKCYIKVIVKKETDKVLGIHITGPHAGDIIQGYAVAIKNGLTIAQLQSTIGIHPTISEEVVKISITKSSGLSPKQASCCS